MAKLGIESGRGYAVKKFLSLLVRHWIKTPVKVSLTLLAIALGSAILILSISAGIILENEVVSGMNEKGVIVYAANGKWSSYGELEQKRTGDWDSSIYDILKSDGASISEAALIVPFPLPEIYVNGKSYKIRNTMGTDHSYLDVFSLDIIQGVSMTEKDYMSGFKKIWLSEDTAIIFFGSAEAAIGQYVSPPGKEIEKESRKRALLTKYIVAGVYENPTEIARRSYGIADVIFPVTSFFPVSEKGKGVLDYLAGRIVVKSDFNSVDTVESEISQIVKNNYGEYSPLIVWEGKPNGFSTYMDELRRAVSVFTVSVNILGIVILLTSSLGIFSIMVVEALGRRREIALERSLGASRLQVIREFWSWSIMLTLLGTTAGVILAFLLAESVLGNITPLLGEFAENMNPEVAIQLPALLSGIILTILCGGILGLLPAFAALRGNIADTLREI